MDRLSKVLHTQYRYFHKHPDDHLMVIMDENIQEWYMMVVGLDSPFLGGEYIFKFKIPVEFPMRPPSIEALTPNGVFDIGGPLCISIGEFHEHEHTWVPSIGMPGCGRQIWNALLCFNYEDAIQPVVRVIYSTDDEKTKFAEESREWNRTKFPELMSKFEEYARDHPDYIAVKSFSCHGVKPISS